MGEQYTPGHSANATAFMRGRLAVMVNLSGLISSRVSLGEDVSSDLGYFGAEGRMSFFI
jgi:hypothetical protein